MALFVVLALAVSVVPAFAAEPLNPTPPLPQPEAVKDGRTASVTPMLAQPADVKRFYSQFELRTAEMYRLPVGTYIESPGSGSSGGSSSGDGS
jgi:hypothetical protein